MQNSKLAFQFIRLTDHGNPDIYANLLSVRVNSPDLAQIAGVLNSPARLEDRKRTAVQRLRRCQTRKRWRTAIDILLFVLSDFHELRVCRVVDQNKIDQLEGHVFHEDGDGD